MKKLLIGFLISLFLISQGECATGWLKTKPAGTDSPADLDTSIGENNAALDLALSAYIGGCKISYSTVAQITVGAGGVVVSNSAGTVRLMLANTSATTVTWANIESGGSEAASTVYYVYAVGSATTDTVFTVVISTSSTAPSGVTYYKRLGYFYNDASSNITNIKNDNQSINYYDSGWFAVASGDISYSKTHNLGTTKVLITLLVSPNSDGSGYCVQTAAMNVSNGSSNYGMYTTALSTTSITIQSAQSGLYNITNTSHTLEQPTSGYARIIIVSLD